MKNPLPFPNLNMSELFNNDFLKDIEIAAQNQNVSSVLDISVLQQNIPQFSNEKLCEMIVCDRYFGLQEKISVICMEELSRRRLAGDKFNFEQYIEQAYKTLPVLNFSPTDIGSVFRAAMNKKSQ